MTTGTIFKPSVALGLEHERPVGGKITVFHCFNAIGDITCRAGDYEIRDIKMPCSGMNREAVLLKAFEAGADAVIVLACPEGACHYLEGNLRAKKRVAAVRKLLDEIGLDGRRLNFYNVAPGDRDAVGRIIAQTVAGLDILGPSPAR